MHLGWSVKFLEVEFDEGLNKFRVICTDPEEDKEYRVWPAPEVLILDSGKEVRPEDLPEDRTFFMKVDDFESVGGYWSGRMKLSGVER